MPQVKESKQKAIFKNNEGIIALSKKLSSGDTIKGLKILFLGSLLFERIGPLIKETSSLGVHSSLVGDRTRDQAINKFHEIGDELKTLLDETSSKEARENIITKFSPLTQLIDRLTQYHEILMRYSINQLVEYKKLWIEGLENFVESSEEDIKTLGSRHKQDLKDELNQFIVHLFGKYKYLLSRNKQIVQNNYTASHLAYDVKLARNLLLLPEDRKSKSEINFLLDRAYKNEQRNISKEKRQLIKKLEKTFLSITSEEELNRKNDKQVQMVMKALKKYIGKRNPKSPFFQGKHFEMKPFRFEGVDTQIKNILDYIEELYEAAKKNKADTTLAIAEQVTLYSFFNPHLSLEKAVSETGLTINTQALRKNKSKKEDEWFFKPLAERILENHKK